MGEGRQTVDYMWAINRLMRLEQEWKKGLWCMKLDLEKAFDRLDRHKFLSKVEGRLGRNEVYRAWWNMFLNIEADLVTAWGHSSLRMQTGIRQGAVESPQIFATAVDWILEQVATNMGWDPANDVFTGLETAAAAFVDDMILWSGGKDKLRVRVEGLMTGLAEWGLRLNLQKCQVYASPFTKEAGHLEIAGARMEVDDHLSVMGVPFKVGISAREAWGHCSRKSKGAFGR